MHTSSKNIKFFNKDINGNIDFLYISEISLPIYFNESRLNDYRLSIKEKWLDLFSSEKHNQLIFNYDKTSDFLYFTASKLNKNQKLHQ